MGKHKHTADNKEDRMEKMVDNIVDIDITEGDADASGAEEIQQQQHVDQEAAADQQQVKTEDDLNWYELLELRVHELEKERALTGTSTGWQEGPVDKDRDPRKRAAAEMEDVAQRDPRLRKVNRVSATRTFRPPTPPLSRRSAADPLSEFLNATNLWQLFKALDRSRTRTDRNGVEEVVDCATSLPLRKWRTWRDFDEAILACEDLDAAKQLVRFHARCVARIPDLTATTFAKVAVNVADRRAAGDAEVADAIHEAIAFTSQGKLASIATNNNNGPPSACATCGQAHWHRDCPHRGTFKPAVTPSKGSSGSQ